MAKASTQALSRIKATRPKPVKTAAQTALGAALAAIKPPKVKGK